MSQEIAVQAKAKSLQSLLQISKSQIEMALPKHLSPDRLLRIAMTEARKLPALLDCTQTSFIGAIIQAAQLGLEPGGALGHCYLIPFKNTKTGNTEVQFIVGYRGMIDLAYRSPKVKKIIARAVYDKDKFSYDFGLDEKLVHVPAQDGSGDKLTHVYCIVELDDGVRLFDVMTRRDVEDAKARSKSAEFGPWKTDYEAMAKKSVVRRFFKFMPSSIEIQEAVGLDEAADRGEQNNGAIIEAVGVRVEEKPSATTSFQQNLDSAPIPEKKNVVILPKAENKPDPNAESQNNFENFKPGPIITPRSININELILEVVEAGEKAGLDSMKKLSVRCKRDFDKIMGDMTGEELETLLVALQKEAK